MKRVNYQTSGELRVVLVNLLCFYLLLQYNFSSHVSLELYQNSLHILCLVDV